MGDLTEQIKLNYLCIEEINNRFGEIELISPVAGLWMYKNECEDGSLNKIIEIVKKEDVIGYIYQEHLYSDTISISFVIKSEFQQHGYMKEAIKKYTDLVVYKRNNKLETYGEIKSIAADAKNKASYKVLKANNFKINEHLKEKDNIKEMILCI